MFTFLQLYSFCKQQHFSLQLTIKRVQFRDYSLIMHATFFSILQCLYLKRYIRKKVTVHRPIYHGKEVCF